MRKITLVCNLCSTAFDDAEVALQHVSDAPPEEYHNDFRIEAIE